MELETIFFDPIKEAYFFVLGWWAAVEVAFNFGADYPIRKSITAQMLNSWKLLRK